MSESQDQPPQDKQPQDKKPQDKKPQDKKAQDQFGFEDLKPHPDHPLAQQDTENIEEIENSEEAKESSISETDYEKEDIPTEDPGEKDLSFLDHLDDLRTTLIQSSGAAIVATIICWFISSNLLDILVRPIREQGVYFTAPNEAFLVRLKLAGAMGLFAVAPFIFFRLYMFVLPGLHKKEKKVITPLLLATALLFYTGVSFGFLIVVPQVMVFLMGFGTAYLSPLIGVGEYFGFVSKLCLAFGLVFQLPLLVLFLSVLGVVDPKKLLKTWRYAIIAIFALSAVLTPPDVVSQIMMAGPVLILYWSSVLVALIVTKKRRKED